MADHESKPSRLPGTTRAPKPPATATDENRGPSAPKGRTSEAPDMFALALQLSDVTDELTMRLADVEGALVEARLGVEGEVSIESDEGPNKTHTHTTLAFKKIGSDWGLFILEAPEGLLAKGEKQHTPLRKASKSLRIRAAKRLPGLVHGLVDTVAQQTIEIKHAIDQLDEVTTFLRGRK